jgi:hypothetical protein
LEKHCQFAGIRLFHALAIGMTPNASEAGEMIQCDDGQMPVGKQHCHFMRRFCGKIVDSAAFGGLSPPTCIICNTVQQ